MTGRCEVIRQVNIHVEMDAEELADCVEALDFYIRHMAKGSDMSRYQKTLDDLNRIQKECWNKGVR